MGFDYTTLERLFATLGDREGHTNEDGYRLRALARGVRRVDPAAKPLIGAGVTSVSWRASPLLLLGR